MKKKVILIVGIVILLAVGVGYFVLRNQGGPSVGIDNNISNADAKEGTTIDGENVLVVYFSHGGNTQKLAKEVSDQVGGDFRRIEPITAYPTDDSLFDYTETEQANDGRPEIQDLDVDMSQYDTIFLGYPIWWYTYPQIILSFFDQYDVSGKTIVPFVTHGGSSMSGTEEDMRAYLADQNVTVLEGLPVSRNDIEGDQSETVTDWLISLNLED